MHIKKMLRQHRRDFTAIFECEHCDATKEVSGYDDDFYHEMVIPNIPCDECGKKAGEGYAPRATKYAKWEVK